MRVAVVGLVLIFVNRDTRREEAHPSTRRMGKEGALPRAVADFETRTSRGHGLKTQTSLRNGAASDECGPTRSFLVVR